MQRPPHPDQIAFIRTLERLAFFIIGETLHIAYMQSGDKDIDLGDVPIRFSLEEKARVFCLNGAVSTRKNKSPSKTPADTPAKTPSKTPAKTPLKTPTGKERRVRSILSHYYITLTSNTTG